MFTFEYVPLSASGFCATFLCDDDYMARISDYQWGISWIAVKRREKNIEDENESRYLVHVLYNL